MARRSPRRTRLHGIKPFFEAICEHLRQTNWKIERIAEETGFGAADELCRFFKRMTNQTAGDYRKEMAGGSNR